METYWKDDGGNNESFWEHEWGKPGNCISTFDPNCYVDYTPQEEVVDFFQKNHRPLQNARYLRIPRYCGYRA